jgi:WhiB family redox-sensing transcriptional regulator
MADITLGDWRAAGACVTAEPDLFFPISTYAAGVRQAQRALRVCANCPVRRQCLEFAMRTGEKEGIWGGTTPEERVRLRRRAAVPRRPASGAAAEIRAAGAA